MKNMKGLRIFETFVAAEDILKNKFTCLEEINDDLSCQTYEVELSLGMGLVCCR